MKAIGTLLALAIVLVASPAAAHKSHASGFEKSNTWIKGTAEGREKSACKQAKAKAEDKDNLKLPSDHYLEFSQCACWHLEGKTQCTVSFKVASRPLDVGEHLTEAEKACRLPGSNLHCP